MNNLEKLFIAPSFDSYSKTITLNLHAKLQNDQEPTICLHGTPDPFNNDNYNECLLNFCHFRCGDLFLSYMSEEQFKEAQSLWQKNEEAPDEEDCYFDELCEFESEFIEKAVSDLEGLIVTSLEKLESASEDQSFRYLLQDGFVVVVNVFPSQFMASQFDCYEECSWKQEKEPLDAII